MLLSEREGQRGLELERSWVERLKEAGRPPGRGPEGMKPRVVWPWRRLSSPGGRKRRVGSIQILFGKSRNSQSQLIT